MIARPPDITDCRVTHHLCALVSGFQVWHVTRARVGRAFRELDDGRSHRVPFGSLAYLECRGFGQGQLSHFSSKTLPERRKVT